MTQKLYRDRKGRFVSGEKPAESLKRMIDIIKHAGMRVDKDQRLFRTAGIWASHIRQFRNKYKIYETF